MGEYSKRASESLGKRVVKLTCKITRQSTEIYLSNDPKIIDTESGASAIHTHTHTNAILPS